MKTIYATLLACIIAANFIGCAEKKETPIVQHAMYDHAMNSRDDESLKSCNNDLAFWKVRLDKTPDSETARMRIAGLLASRFAITGEIEDIKRSDSLYALVMISTGGTSASVHRAMAANNITQHQFHAAFQHVNEALAIGESRAASLYMLTDVKLELGDIRGAQESLDQTANKRFFPYLIRKAKLKDHEGDLDSAIVLMEIARDQVKENHSLYLWTQSNLADMYGHAGRVEEAYGVYVDILKTNPDYDYALKGIAWIAFSHDHNYAEAKRIARYINEKRSTPDMHLFLAEIADAENDIPEKARQLEKFAAFAIDRKYGDMYNKYLALIASEEFSDPDRTIALAQKEIQNRPTAQSYDLLAWGYFHQGNYAQALAVAEENIVDKTFEPDALYHLGMIYKANGKSREARKYFKRAAESGFELGPQITQKIENELANG